jgi:SAM-dependent methyltransferase
MPRTQPFDLHRDQYEDWFVRHPFVFSSELAALREVLPDGKGVEIGVGTGLFAEKLGIADGVEPSPAMAQLAHARGIHVCRGIAEELPYHDKSFDFALMVTTICFVDSPRIAILEMARVVKKDGLIVLGFVDRDSSLGKQYEEFKEKNVFYKDAIFYSAQDVITILESAGLSVTTVRQTVFGKLDDILSVQPCTEGFSSGGFVVIAAKVS